MRVPTWVVVGGMLAVLALAGCGRPAGQVSGRVTWKGEPVVGAELAFESRGGPGGEAFGTSGEGGRYSLSYGTAKGLPPGTYRVTVTRHTLPNGKPLPPGEAGAALKNQEGRTVLRSYVFEVEVREGESEHHFELTNGREQAEPPG